ncbi:hypothetical protein [Marinitoga sp. 38H-ov]|uniref:hypothetical protein n=1 Tax=Marinitoga sp. 38H-ov TaxID=1755814 RepID=UPI0013E9A417|nr:hypothetical protein [Marinitoga sp. 38H-ov]
MRKYILSIIFLIIYLLSSQIIFNYIFQNEPYFYYGSFPIESKNLKFSKEFPQQAKAVLSLEDNILKIYLPKDSDYFDLIFKDIKVILYDISIKLNKIVKPYFIEVSNLKSPDIYLLFLKISGLIVYTIIFFNGLFFSVFDKNNLKLLFLHYYKTISLRIFSFLFVILSFFLIIYFFNSNLIIYILSALSMVFLSSVSKNFYIYLLMYIIGLILSLNLYNIKYFIIILFLSFVINIIINTIIIYFTKTNKVKEEN